MITIPALLLLAGLGLRILVDSDLFLGPSPADFRIAIAVPLYKSGQGWSTTDSQHLGNPLGAKLSPPDGTGRIDYRMEDNPTTNLEYGYALIHEAGPNGFRSWFGEESVWIQASDLPNGNTPDSPTLDKLLAARTPMILADQRLVGRTVGISIAHPCRQFLNWRGLARWWATAAMVCGSAILIAGGTLLWRVNQRPALITAGLCPACRYLIRGMKADRCPECGELLSTYEQTIVAAQLPMER